MADQDALSNGVQEATEQSGRGPDLPVADRANLLDASCTDHTKTTGERDRTRIDAIATRIDSLTTLRGGIRCPHCQELWGVRQDEYGYALVNTDADTLAEWHLGDRCPEHAAHLPPEADAIVLYRVEPGRRKEFYCRRRTVRASAVAGSPVR